MNDRMQVITWILGLMAIGLTLTACEPATNEELAKRNSEDPLTGIVGKIDDCTVYRMYNSGAGESYIFFTKCDNSDVNTQWTTETGGKSRTKHQHNVQTLQPPRN